MVSDPGPVARLARRVRESRAPTAALLVAAILEASVVPIPVEVALLPMMIADRQRTVRFAAAVTAGNLVGALIVYAIGWAVADPAALGVVDQLGWSGALEDYRAAFERHGFFAILLVGVSPIPLQVALLTAGAAAYNLWLFALAVVIGRGIRYGTFAVLVAVAGDQAEALWRRNKVLAGLAALGVAAALWAISEGIRALAFPSA